MATRTATRRQPASEEEREAKESIRRTLMEEGYSGEQLEYLTDLIYNIYTTVKKEIGLRSSILLSDVVYPLGVSGYHEDEEGNRHVSFWLVSARIGEDDPKEVYPLIEDMLEEIMIQALQKVLGIDEEELVRQVVDEGRYIDITHGEGEVDVDLRLGDFLQLARLK